MTKLTKKDVLLFTFQLSLLLNQNFLLQDSLSIMLKSSLSRNNKKLIKNVLNDLKDGKSLYCSLAESSKAFSNYYIASVKSGEETGNLACFLDNIYRYLDRQITFESKAKVSSFYPLFLLILTIIVSCSLIVFVIPSMVNITNMLDVDLPESTKNIISLMNFIKGYWFLILMFLALMSFIIFFFKEKFKYSLDYFLLKIPFYGQLIRKQETMKFFNEMSLLLKNNIKIDDAIVIASEAIVNLRLYDEIQLSIPKLRSGANIADTISQIVAFDPFIIALMNTGEESNKIAENLMFLVEILIKEVEDKREKTIKIIEPVMLSFIGCIILILICNLYLPLINILNGINIVSY